VDRSSAEDLVQEAFLRIYRHANRIDDSLIAAYARQTIVNLNRSAFRRLQLSRREALHEPPEGIDPSERALDEDVRRALRTLPVRTRACLALRFYEDMKERDIAETLDMSLAAVKKQIERGLGRLRDALGETVIT